MSIARLTLEVTDPAAAKAFYADAFGLGDDPRLAFRASDAPTSGFRGYSISLIVAQPGDADSLLNSAIAAGATVVKPGTKSFWGYGGVVAAPDGSVWKVATQSKKDTKPVSREFSEIVLQIGVSDVGESKQFYVSQGLKVAKSFGKKYVQFETSPSGLTLTMLSRKAVAKDAGVPAEGGDAHGIVVGGPASFTDPDGFVWEKVDSDTLR